ATMRCICSLITIIVLALSSQASVTVSTDILSEGEGTLPPSPNILCIDVMIDVSATDSWTVGGLVGRTSSSATLLYAFDPNGRQLLTAPGTQNRFVTFFSAPRARDGTGRYTSTAAVAAGGYSPTSPTVTATPTEMNVTFFSFPPPTAGSPSLDGAIF